MLAGDALYDDVASDSTTLVGNTTLRVNSNDAPASALSIVEGDTVISARLSDYKNKIGEETIWFNHPRRIRWHHRCKIRCVFLS